MAKNGTDGVQFRFWNWTWIVVDWSGIEIELNIVGPELEFNWNPLFPQLHSIAWNHLHSQKRLRNPPFINSSDKSVVYLHFTIMYKVTGAACFLNAAQELHLNQPLKQHP